MPAIDKKWRNHLDADPATRFHPPSTQVEYDVFALHLSFVARFGIAERVFFTECG